MSIKINESIDLTGLTSSKKDGVNPVFKIKKIQRKSILDSIEDDDNIVTDVIDVPQINNIVVPQTIQQTIQQQKTNTLNIQQLKNKKVEELKKRALLRNNNKNISVVENLQNLQKNQTEELNVIEANKQLIETYQEVTNIELPEDINIIEIATEIQEASEVIPDTKNLDITDFEIVEVKNKTGWFKNKVTIKSEIASEELSELATKVKSQTNNCVIHRAMDFRTIGNTNKNQLKDSKYKLYPISYVFNPLPNTEIKAAKYTRILISIPMEFNTNNRVLIFIQESRNKFIFEINFDIDFLAKLIADYYIVGFDVTKTRLKSNSVDNPFNLLINKLTLSRDYLVKPIQNEDGLITQIIIKTKTGKYQWLKFIINKDKLEGTYSCYGKSEYESDFQTKFKKANNQNEPFTMSYLLSDDFSQRLYNAFNITDWSKLGIGEDDIDNREFYLMKKITYRALKNAFIEICDISNSEDNTSGVFVKEVLSQLDTSKDIDSGYKAEIIIGKTNFIDYYVLSWLAVKIIGGDKRHGKDYITTDKYYEENFVKDKRPYQERERTVLKKQNVDRNYNSRPFMFQIMYSINGKEYNFQAKTFEEIKEKTGFLTTNPKAI